LISLVKDVERIGDYAKNLAEVADFHTGPLPDDAIVAELREVREGVEAAFEATAVVFEESHTERATELIHQGRDLAHRCDKLVEKIAASEHNAGTTTATVLGTRFYKRIGGHVLNVLSSVVMPLHKLDYYDEDDLLKEETRREMR
jgi:phosphate uptake regulator